MTSPAPRSQNGSPSCAPTTRYARPPTQSTGGPPATSPSTPARAGPCCATARSSSTTVVPYSLTAVSRRSRIGRARGSAPSPEPAKILSSGGMVNPPGTPGGGPDSSVEEMDYVFHELHADCHHVLCGVCGSQ